MNLVLSFFSGVLATLLVITFLPGTTIFPSQISKKVEPDEEIILEETVPSPAISETSQSVLSLEIENEKDDKNIISDTLTPTVTPISATPTPTLFPTNTPTVSPTPTVKPIAIPPQVRTHFETYSKLYAIDIQALASIAECESHFNNNAISKNGLYVGMFQFSESSWVSLRREMGIDSNPNLRYGAEESIQTAAYALSKGKGSMWPSCSS